MKIYEVRAFQFRDYYASKALVASALSVTVAQIDALVAANVAAGKPPYPVARYVPVVIGGALSGLRTPTTVQVMLDEIDVRESIP